MKGCKLWQREEAATLCRNSLTKDEHVEADAQSPHVGQAGMVGLSRTDFGRHERGSAGGSADKVARARQLRAAEVGDLDVASRAEQKIVRLEVAMGDFV